MTLEYSQPFMPPVYIAPTAPYGYSSMMDAYLHSSWFLCANPVSYDQFKPSGPDPYHFTRDLLHNSVPIGRPRRTVPTPYIGAIAGHRHLESATAPKAPPPPPPPSAMANTHFQFAPEVSFEPFAPFEVIHPYDQQTPSFTSLASTEEDCNAGIDADSHFSHMDTVLQATVDSLFQDDDAEYERARERALFARAQKPTGMSRLRLLAPSPLNLGAIGGPCAYHPELANVLLTQGPHTAVFPPKQAAASGSGSGAVVSDESDTDYDEDYYAERSPPTDEDECSTCDERSAAERFADAIEYGKYVYGGSKEKDDHTECWYMVDLDGTSAPIAAAELA